MAALVGGAPSDRGDGRRRAPPLHAFRLDRERPHALAGLPARLAAKLARHNFCLWPNGQLGRPDLAFADLIDW